MLLLPDKNFQHIVFTYLSFSSFSYRQNMFLSRNVSSNMPKSTLFSMKNRKNRRFQTPSLVHFVTIYMLRA